MRVFPLVLSLWFAAGAAQAETWRILHWDRFSLIAVDVEHKRTTGLSNPALPVLEVNLYPTSDKPEARIGEEEIDCADQRVRQRTGQMYFGAGQVTGLNPEIQPWRDPGEEKDRMLVRALCQPDGLKNAPSVAAADIHEAMAAHLAASRAPKSLAPGWTGAWAAFAGGGAPDAIPSIELAVQAQHPLVVAAISDEGSVILLSTAIEKVGELRYRFHEAQVGAQERGDIAAMWALREADCGLRRTRTIAWAGFDAQAKKKFGHDTNSIGTPFETPRPNSSDEIVMHHVCGASRLIAGKPMVEANLGQAIAAYRYFFEGDDASAMRLGDAKAWREAYEQACDACTAEHDEPAGSTAGSWKARSRS
jgi:hypothetical protein